ncbi:MAG: hypothetical protein E7663_02855 [Ruminococcaceae bacterium]|nr:hypothetical protein [Oscillospiraceae bacterium]
MRDDKTVGYRAYIRDCLEAFSFDCSKKDISANPYVEKLYAKLKKLQKLAAKLDESEKNDHMVDIARMDYSKGSPKILLLKIKQNHAKRTLARLDKKFWR